MQRLWHNPPGNQGAVKEKVFPDRCRSRKLSGAVLEVIIIRKS
jgi:hypothetical protein